MNKKELIEHLNNLNQIEVIKVKDTDKERIVFKDNNVFNLFGDKDTGVLNPFNDYSYIWLNDFLSDFTDYLENSKDDLKEDLENFRDKLSEYIDNRVNVYTSDLTTWLNDNNNNVNYLTEVTEEIGEKDGFKLLQLAQYKAIEEIYANALSIIEKEFI